MLGGYAIAKGYDALVQPKPYGPSADYLMVYNMTKMIARDTIGKY